MEGQELESDVLINGFTEAVSNGFLELAERKPDVAEQDAPQAQQTGDTGKVKVIFHMGFLDGKEIFKEMEIDPNAPVEFPGVETLPKPEFEGWFKDAEFTKSVKVDKAKSPKEGELHFYGKYSPKPENPHNTPDSNGDEGQIMPPPLSSDPVSPNGEESAKADSENK
jgi:hypothetical protein